MNSRNHDGLKMMMYAKKTAVSGRKKNTRYSSRIAAARRMRLVRLIKDHFKNKVLKIKVLDCVIGQRRITIQPSLSGLAQHFILKVLDLEKMVSRSFGCHFYSCDLAVIQIDSISRNQPQRLQCSHYASRGQSVSSLHQDLSSG